MDEDEVEDIINEAATDSPSKRPQAEWRNLLSVRMDLDDQFINAMNSETRVTDVAVLPQESLPSSKPIGSIIHDHQVNRKTIWVSFDIETGGPRCGIIQLSAVFYDQDVVLLGQFDQYVKPPQFAVFLPQACECHGINHRDDQRLKGAPQIEVVWNYFCEYVDVIFSTGVKYDCVGILVAWNGKACDME